MSQNITVRQTTITLGFWSALLTTVFTILRVVLALVSTTAEWSGIESYAKDFTFLQMANFIPVLLLTLTVVILMACIHCVAPETKKGFILIGTAFSSVYAAIICTNYYIPDNSKCPVSGVHSILSCGPLFCGSLLRRSQ